MWRASPSPRVALAVAVVVLATGGTRFADLLVLAGLLITLAASRATLGVHVDLPGAEPPQRPVLFFNPKSGGGKAERFKLAEEARKRGIEPIELGPPAWDLEALVRGALERGADGLAMAGGDGSQAIVAAIAAERGLPYACIPAGTRNHFALDLGVDRDDVVGALDAFVDGGERIVDLAEVNGRVFVNNVSLGLYAEAVQREGYRDAKLRTLLDTVPDVLGPHGGELDMRWTGPSGQVHRAGAAVLVSNNRYRLGRAVGSGTRPRIDDGLLGITVVGAPAGRGEERRRAAAPVARVVRAGVRRRRGRPGPGRHRRRGARARRAVALPDPARRAARADRPRAPRRLPLGHGARGAPGRTGRHGADRRRPHPTTHHPRRGDPHMDLMEITEKERLRREEVAVRLHALADALARHNEVEFERGGLRFKVHVPDEVDFKLEIEIDDDERELEMELKW